MYPAAHVDAGPVGDEWHGCGWYGRACRTALNSDASSGRPVVWSSAQVPVDPGLGAPCIDCHRPATAGAMPLRSAAPGTDRQRASGAGRQ